MRDAQMRTQVLLNAATQRPGTMMPEKPDKKPDPPKPDAGQIGDSKALPRPPPDKPIPPQLPSAPAVPSTVLKLEETMTSVQKRVDVITLDGAKASERVKSVEMTLASIRDDISSIKEAGSAGSGQKLVSLERSLKEFQEAYAGASARQSSERVDDTRLLRAAANDAAEMAQDAFDRSLVFDAVVTSPVSLRCINEAPPLTFSAGAHIRLRHPMKKTETGCEMPFFDISPEGTIYEYMCPVVVDDERVIKFLPVSPSPPQ